ncbi:MAG: hypothetical protein ACFFG0_06655 [Candidatus Thorarchaeota archaeon]
MSLLVYVGVRKEIMILTTPVTIPLPSPCSSGTWTTELIIYGYDSIISVDGNKIVTKAGRIFTWNGNPPSLIIGDPILRLSLAGVEIT